MPILAATNIELAYGDRRILDAVSLSVEPGERVGMVGRNGCGKSSLFKVLTGHLKADGGQVVLQAGAKSAYLAQEHGFEPGKTLREEAAAAFGHIEELQDELHDVFEAMGEAHGDELQKLLRRQAEIEKKIDAGGGLNNAHRIDAVLHGLGFTDAQFTVPVEGLSGGQGARLALAKILLTEPDILLLDEPTNHLDIQGRIWLEGFLKHEYRGAVLMISHDRYLLDAVVSRIIEVEPVPTQGGRLIEYPGNYKAFRKLRAERLEVQRRAWETQQTKFKQEEAFIRKYKAGQRAKQARGRESRLEREKATLTIEKPLNSTSMRLELPKAERTGDIVANVRGLKKAYPNEDGSARVLFDDLDLTIERGQRWGILGPNGAGKTTLVRCLLGEADADAGSVSLGTKLSIGYFKQSHESLDPELTVIRYLQKIVRNECPDQLLSEQAARNLAGAFLFSGESQEKELGLLSGGERARAALAGLMASAKNVLVLDEPTNHLDIPSAERLEDALRLPEKDERNESLFDGTLILISHDRALLDACCDQLIVLDGEGDARAFNGNYSEWHAKQEAKKAEAAARSNQQKSTKPQSGRPQQSKPSKSPESTANTASNPAAIRPKTDEGAPKKSKWSWMRVEQLEEKIAFLEGRIAEIDRALDDPDIWTEIDKANALTTERDEFKTELEGVEAEWLREAD